MKKIALVSAAVLLASNLYASDGSDGCLYASEFTPLGDIIAPIGLPHICVHNKEIDTNVWVTDLSDPLLDQTSRDRLSDAIAQIEQ